MISTMDGARKSVMTIIALGDPQLVADVTVAMDTQKHAPGGHARFLWKAVMRELARGEGGEATALTRLTAFHARPYTGKVYDAVPAEN